MEKLNFLTAGIPIISQKKGYSGAFADLQSLNLDGMELEFVHGVRISQDGIDTVKKAAEKGFVITAHAPFYINLNSSEPEKADASEIRILDTARAANLVGGFSITFHAAFYTGKDKDEVFKIVAKRIENITNILKSENNNIFIRPETTGKKTQWGDLEEIIRLSSMFENVLPCVDFSHLHARENGAYNTYDEFAGIFELIGKNSGDNALKNFHAHVAGIDYGAKGEKRHLNLEESDFNYKDLMKAFKDFDVKGAVVCESPNIEADAALMKQYYLSV